VVLSAIVGALAGRWLVSDPGPGDRQTLSRDIPLLAQNLELRTQNLELGN